MAELRVRLTVQGPVATPLHSGTLFGHLCWAMRYRDGEPALVRWLEALPEEPFLISDAFPADCLPRPILGPKPPPIRARDEKREDCTKRMQGEKRLRKQPWVGVDDYFELRQALSESQLMTRLSAHTAQQRRGEVQRLRQAHNTINRHTGTTPEAGGLYFMEEEWRDGDAAKLDVYVRTTLEMTLVHELFELVGSFGYGRDASLGRGRLSALVEPADSRLFAFSGNRLMSLSHGTHTTNMGNPRYRLHTHYGKLGGLYAGGEHRPWKHPLMLLRPGATFSPLNGGVYGELLRGVHQDNLGICHNAWHLCLPFTETEETQ